MPLRCLQQTVRLDSVKSSGNALAAVVNRPLTEPESRRRRRLEPAAHRHTSRARAVRVRHWRRARRSRGLHVVHVHVCVHLQNVSPETITQRGFGFPLRAWPVPTGAWYLHVPHVLSRVV